MANTSNVQIVQDGPRNVVVKLVGIVDTSDVAATGTIGASGFTTTIGSNVITFVAGALVPTVGQYITFSDTTTTFNANTYITGIVSATSITVSNVAKATNAAAAITITGTAGAVVYIDPAKLSTLDSNNQQVPTNLIVDYVSYNIEAPLAVNIFWEATSNVLLNTLVNSGDDMDYRSFGGMWNNAGAGKTGRLVYTTQGWTAAAILSYNITLECRKS
jgi:hypothetical protein